MIVADASIALAFIVDDEHTQYADAAIGHVGQAGGVVPGNFHSEVAHGLLQAERRGRITETLSSSALREILALPFDVEMPDVQRALVLARKHGLTCYDAFYLTLALQLDRPLATIDAALVTAAREANVLWRA